MPRQVNMPEKKDSMGQGMQIFQAAKSIYDMKNGDVKPGGGTETNSMAAGGQSSAMNRRYNSGGTV